MSKFKYTNKKGQVNIILKLAQNESIDVGVAGYLANNRLRGFLVPAPEKTGGILYSGTQGIALSQFLARPINKEQFYIIIAHLLEAYKTIVSVNLNPAMINLDPDYITISENTGEIYLVYQPINNCQTCNQGFMRCFGQICSMLKYASPQDPVSIGMFISFAKGLPVFSVVDIEKFIMKNSPNTYNFVQRMPFNDPMAAPSIQISQRPVHNRTSSSEDASQNTVLASDNMKKHEAETVLPVISEFAPPVVQKPVPEQPADPVVPEIIPESESDSMTEYVPEDDTDVTVEIPVPEMQAKLVRRSNGESFIISSDTFVIGKERARVNCCVSGNNTISRVHATILRKTDGYYIIDNDSTNKTYINGSNIPALFEFRLNSGDIIKLSNEEFDFIC